MNKVILMGRLTADPDVRVTAGEEAHTVARASIAVDRKYSKGEQKADFIRLEAWNKKAEFFEKYLKKGSKVLVVGSIRTGSYQDRDGKTQYTTDILVEEVEFADSKKGDDAGASAPETNNNGFINIPEGIEEELPFT